MTQLWAPSTDYTLGNLVLPRSAPLVVQQDLTNGNFEAGASGWALGANWSITNAGTAYQGTWKAQHALTAGTSLITNNNEVPVNPGQSITATVVIRASGAGTGRVGLEWRDAAHALLGTRVYGNVIGASGWQLSTVTANAPASAAYLVLVVEGVTTGAVGDLVEVDAAAWNYAYVAPPTPLIYEATVAGRSGTNEPTWPTVAGGTVVDGTITWTARAASRVTWTAKPILKSGTVEPVWPTTPGQAVADNTISWIATTRRIEDERCPHSPVATIGASKVWAGDDEITRFCATNNCKDWTTADDAGYLPTGMKMKGNNSVAALSIYRSNLIAMSATDFEMWSIDEDPAANALMDTKEGIGTEYNLALLPVGDDLYMLTPLGYRSIGVVASSGNLATGDIGSPVDTLVRSYLAATLAAGKLPMSFTAPATGQFWGVLNDKVMVFTMNRLGAVGAWSIYNFPSPILSQTQLGSTVYLLDESLAVRTLDDSVNYDEVVTAAPGVYTKNYFDGVIQWPYLDFGVPGQDKMLDSFDIVGVGTPTVQVGYDQRNLAALTDPYIVDADTLNQGGIPMPLTAPTFSFKITYAGAPGNFWELDSLNVNTL